MAICGPSGAGKTYTALRIASGLGSRIAVIDTEHGSAAKYSAPPPEKRDPAKHRLGINCFDFDVLELAHYDPRNYIDALAAAESEGYEVVVIDSLSHAWTGKGGILEQADKAGKRAGGNSFAGWKDATPVHNSFIEAILGSRCHVIGTMRSKVDYILEANASTGKLSPRKVGMAPIQREGMDYEFDVVGELDLDHNLMIGKTRYAALDRQVIPMAGEELGRTLAAWLSDGEKPAEPAYRLPQPMIDELERLLAALEVSPEVLRKSLSNKGVSRIEQLLVDDAAIMIRKLEGMLVKFPFEEPAATQPDNSTTAEYVIPDQSRRPASAAN